MCRFKTSPCMPAPRAHVFSTCARGAGIHGDVFESTHGGRFERRHALPPSSNTPHTQQKKNEGEQEEVIVSSAYQNLPTKGYHVPQRFTEGNHWMTIQHECSHIFLQIELKWEFDCSRSFSVHLWIQPLKIWTKKLDLKSHQPS